MAAKTTTTKPSTTKSTPAKTAAKTPAPKPAKKTAARSQRALAAATGPQDEPQTPAAAAAEMLALDELEPHSRNVRRDLGDLTDLTASVKQHGVLQPLLVAPHPSQPYKYVIIAGHRRHAAATRAPLSYVPCVVRRDLTGEADVIVAMLTENMQRADLTPIEEAAAYEQLDLLGMKDPAIAKAVARSTETIRARRRLMTLPETTRDLIQARQITLEQAAQLAEFADQPDVITRLEKALGAAGGNSFAYEVNRERDAREKREKRARVEQQLRAAGFRIVPDVPWGQNTRQLFGIDSMTEDEKVNPAALEAHAATGCTAQMVADVTPGGYFDLGCLDAIHQAGKPAAAGLSRGQHDGRERDEVARLGDLDAEDRAAAEAESQRAAQREAEQREQDEADCRAAAAVRLDYLRMLVTGGGLLGATDDVFAFSARCLLEDGLLIEPDAQLLARVLGRDDLAEQHTTAKDAAFSPARRANRFDELDAIAKEITDVAIHLAQKHPARAHLAALAASWEEGSEKPASWTPQALAAGDWRHRRDWLDLLGGPLGYEWTPWEAAALEYADEVAANATVPDGDHRLDEQPDETRTCRECGISAEEALREGCSWVEADLCSACAPARSVEDVPTGGVL